MIRVYDATEKLFKNNGIKIIKPLFAEITKADNSDYYIELEDTLDNLEYYQKGLIYRVNTPWGVQGFRCDNPVIKNNRITCNAWHLTYDSKNYLIKYAEAVDVDCNEAINYFNNNTDTTSPFTVSSDIPTIAKTKAVKNSLFDMFEVLVSPDVYGGHWVRDNFSFGIKASIGEDRGVTLAYQKNISDIEVSEIWDDVCTKILPYTIIKEQEYFLDPDIYGSEYVTLEEELYDIPFTKPIKFDLPKEMDLGNYISDIEKEKIQEWLHSEAVRYLNENKFPKVNYSISASIDNISDIGDLIYVKHPKCNVEITTNVISVKYDAIRGKYNKIEFGNFKREIKSLSQKIVETAKKETEVRLTETKSFLKGELEDATSKINSILGGSLVIYNKNEILVVDETNTNNCMKINSAGIGFSSSGKNGPFNSAWTIDGKLDMQKINVINLTASLFHGRTLQLGGAENESGKFELYDASNKPVALMDNTGLTVYAKNDDYVRLNAEEGFVGYTPYKDENGETKYRKTYWADGNTFHMANAEVDNEIKIAGKIKIVPVSTDYAVGVGFAALS